MGEVFYCGIAKSGRGSHGKHMEHNPEGKVKLYIEIKFLIRSKILFGGTMQA